MARDLISEMQREAARRMPRPPGIIIPGWFWEEWALVAAGTLAVCAGVAAIIITAGG